MDPTPTVGMRSLKHAMVKQTRLSGCQMAFGD